MLSVYFNVQTAIKLAYIAMAAYHATIDNDKMQYYLKESNISVNILCEFINTSSEINGFVLQLKQRPDIILLGFTGTRLDSFATIYEDLDEHLVRFSPPIGGKVSDGFLSATDSILNIITSCIPNINVQQIWLVGHSLGGAIATLTSAKLFTIFPNVSKIITYTYASPRVGDGIFAKNYDNIKKIIANRIQNYWDIIPRLPTHNIQGYRHVKTLDLVVQNQTTESTKCIINAHSPNNTLYDVFDWYYEHQLSTYIELLKTCISQIIQ